MIKISESLSEDTNNIKKVAKGSFIAIAITLIGLLVFSIILTYTKVQENVIPTVIIIITAISILIGGSLATSSMKKNGIINGGLIGLIYMLAIYIISSIIIGDFGVNLYSFIMIVIGILAGCLGGIIGINRK